MLQAGAMFPRHTGVRRVSVPSEFSGIRAIAASPIPEQREDAAFVDNKPGLSMVQPEPAYRHSQLPAEYDLPALSGKFNDEGVSPDL
ncbi:hypothetical protein ABBQ38_005092 [Trebouxia sp. C0009 RCD-2024]